MKKMTIQKSFYNILFSFLILSIILSNLEQTTKDTCNGVNVNKVLHTPAELNNLRNKSENSFYNRYQHFLDFYSGDRSSNTYLKIFDWEAGLFITLMILTIISIIIFFVSICCCLTKCRTSKTGIYFYLSIGFFIGFLALFILMMIYIGFTVSSSNAAECQLYRVPETIIRGSAGEEHSQEFIGYKNFITFLDNFNKEATNLSNIQEKMKNVASSGINNLSDDANQELIIFHSNFNDNKINDGTGSLNAPKSVKAINPNFNITTGSQFQDLSLLSNKVIDSATEARFLADENYITYTNNGLNQLSEYLKTSIVEIEAFFDRYIKEALDNKNYIFIGFWVFFGLSMVLFIMSIICISILICVSKDKCKSIFKILRTLIAVYSFIVLLFMISTFILLIGTASLSAMCKFLSLVNLGGHAAIDEFSKGMDTQAARLIQTCLRHDSTGQIMELTSNNDYTTETYNRLTRLIEGQVSYKKWINSNEISTSEFISINNYDQNNQKILSGLLFDFGSVKTSLSELNNLVACNESQYHFSSQACPNCTIINATSTFSVPSCTTDPQTATLLYSNLKDYISSENIMISNMSPDLETMKTKFIEAKNSLKNVESDFASLNTHFSSTINSISGFNQELSFITQCTNIKVEMQIFENELCFEFGYWLYILTVIACTLSFVLFNLMWSMCLAIRSHDKKYMSRNYVDEMNLQGLSQRETIPEL